MSTLKELRTAQKKLSEQQRKLKAAIKGVPAEELQVERDADAERKRKSRSVGRDIEPRPIGVLDTKHPTDEAYRAKCRERRARLRDDNAGWLREYLSDVFYNPFSDDQLEFIDDCSRAMRYGTAKAKAAPRGGGKSSIVKYLQLKHGLYRQLRFPLVICATVPKATDILRDIKAKLRSPVNRLIHEDFPFECDLARYVAPAPSRCNNVTWGGLPVHIEWAPNRLILPSLVDGCGGRDTEEYGLPEDPAALGTILACLGFTSDDLQGCNVLDIRPDFVMLDDLDSRESLTAEHGRIAENIEECIDKTVAGLGGPNRRLGTVFICTITSRRSAAYKYTDREQKPAWAGERIPRIIEWPTNKDKWDKYVDLREKHEKDDPCYPEARKYVKENYKMLHKGAKLSNEHDYNTDPLEDGEPEHYSALHKCYDYIYKNGMDSFLTEHQNDPPAETGMLTVNVSPSRVLECVGDLEQGVVGTDCKRIVQGVDIRKIEIHTGVLSEATERPHRIIDYGIFGHGTTETTVEQSEGLILENLRKTLLENAPEYKDADGGLYEIELTLIDKGWVGKWMNEEGSQKQWATQPVETFCMEAGLTKFLPCKAMANYNSPKPNKHTVIGDHWHMNLGPGKVRTCSEIIWDADHWHLLVEELFVLPVEDKDRFEIFIPPDVAPYRNHRAFGKHITDGANSYKDKINRGTFLHKPRFIHDHWWDCMAQALVAQNIAGFAQKTYRRKPQGKPKQKAPAPPVEAGIPSHTFSRGRW